MPILQIIILIACLIGGMADAMTVTSSGSGIPSGTSCFALRDATGAASCASTGTSCVLQRDGSGVASCGATLGISEINMSSGVLKLPNGANPTVDAAGETAVDSSAGAGSGIRFYGNASPGGVTLPAYQTKCTTIKGATTADDYAIERFPYATTIRRITVYVIGGTNVVGGLDECTGAGGICTSVTAVDADITATADAWTADDGALTNAAIAADNGIYWHTTSVSGTNTSATICFDYTVDMVN